MGTKGPRGGLWLSLGRAPAQGDRRWTSSPSSFLEFDVSAPVAPRAESWGLTVAYVFDPSGVLWHFAQDTESVGKGP